MKSLQPMQLHTNPSRPIPGLSLLHISARAQAEARNSELAQCLSLASNASFWQCPITHHHFNTRSQSVSFMSRMPSLSDGPAFPEPKIFPACISAPPEV